MAQPVEAMLGAFSAYTTICGWRLCSIPSGSKSPVAEGWNRAENSLSGDQIPPGWNAGLVHAWSGTVAVDIDDMEEAQALLAVQGIDLLALFDADNAVIIDSGVSGHGKLLFAMPAGLILPSKKIVINKKNIIDFRQGTSLGTSAQDVLPPSKHPSGSIYRWAGKGDWRRLPQIPAQLLAFWQSLLEQEQQRTTPLEGHATPASMAEVREALFAIDPSCDRTTWVQVGMALQTIGEVNQCPEIAYQLWFDWSSGSAEKFKPREMAGQWKSFKPRPAGINAATLFFHAYRSGWSRPPPKLDGLFGPAQSAPAEEVKQQLSPRTQMPTCDLAPWPEVLVRRAKEVAKEVGCDATVPLVAGLCAISGAVDKRTSLELSATWRVPPTIWVMTLGEPSDKKSPGSKPMFAPLRKLEQEDRARHAVELLAWQGKEARYAHEMKLYREWQGTPDAQLPNSMAPHVEPLPPKPEPKRLLINDATTQKVVIMSEHRPQGFLLWLDEMNRWLHKLSDPRTTDDRGCWIQGYETGPYAMDRMQSGSIWVEHMAMSLYGNCQPEVFRQHAPATSTDGILQRFLPVSLNPKNNAVWQDSLPTFMSNEAEYEQLVRMVHALPVMSYRLSDRAMSHFRKFCGWAREVQEHERLLNHSSTYQTSLGKLEGNCARIIQLFHIIEQPYAIEIAENTCQRAIETVQQFFYPSLRHAFLEVAAQRDKLGEQVFDVVLQMASVKLSITLSELRRAIDWKAPSGQSRELDNRLRIAMDDLGDFGYVSLFQDHPRSTVWTINPAMAEIFKETRERMILAKQSVIEKLKANVRRDTGAEARIGDALGFQSILPEWMKGA